MSAARAAREAGYSERSAKVTASRLLTKENVRAALAERQAGYAAELEVTRQSVISEIQDALRMGREQQRPEVLVQSAMALAKLCGLLEPVRHKVEVGADASALSARFVSMSDSELLAVASGSESRVLHQR